MNASRVACVNLPHVAVAIEERDNRDLVGRPLAIETPQPGPRLVYDLSLAAHRAGVARGMRLAQARKVCPDLAVLPARPDDYRDTFLVLLEVLGQFTPTIEPADLEHSWLATRGLTAGPPGQRTGSWAPERSLAAELVQQVRTQVGLAARVGLAHGKLTSRIVAQYLQQRDTMVLPPGKETAFLGGLATRHLPLSSDNHARLLQLGLTKIRQYAELPARGILPRFGYDGLRAYGLAHGKDDARIQPWQEAPFLEAEHVFLEPIANQRSLQHHLEMLARQVAQPLSEQFRMAGMLALTITFENGQVASEQRTLAEPASRPATLLVHLDALSERIAWQAPVERVKVAAQGLCPTSGRQLALFRREIEARAGVERALQRLQAKYGPDVVQQGHVLEPTSPLPERRAYLAPWGA